MSSFSKQKSSQECVANSLEAELQKYDNRGHFMNSTFPELVNLVKKKLESKD